MTAYNMAGSGTYNLTYNNASSYTTGGELPSLKSTVFNGTTTISATSAGVTLGNSGTVYNITIATGGTTNLLTLGGDTLRVLGTFTNSATTANTTGIDASAATSTLIFNGTAAQAFNPGTTVKNGYFSNVTINSSWSGASPE